MSRVKIWPWTSDWFGEINQSTHRAQGVSNLACTAWLQATASEKQETPWSSVLDGYDDPNKSYKSFLSKYTELYNASFPLKKIKVKNYSFSKPWLSRCFLKSIKRKNVLYKRYLINSTLEHELSYKRYKNKLNHSLRIAKSFYRFRGS
jgi:hypothetical protein